MGAQSHAEHQAKVTITSSHDAPNAEIQKGMLDVDKRKNSTPCSSIEEFWKVVGVNPNA